MNTTRDAGASASLRRLQAGIAMLLLAIMAPAVPGADLRLLQADAGAVRLRALPPAPGVLAPQQLEISTAGGSVVLLLAPHGALGAVGSGSAGDVQAFTGVVAGLPGSWVAVTRIRSRWSGIWFDGQEFFGIESGAEVAGALQKSAVTAAGPVVFRLRDVVGDDVSLEDDMLHAPSANGQELATSLSGTVLAATEGPTHRLRLSLVADSVLAARDADDLEANLLARLNIIDGLFRNQLGVEVVADSVSSFSQPDLDPFSDTDEPSALLEELSVWRAASAWQRQTPLTHLFTGRDLARRTVGLAYLDTLCSRRYSASLSEARGPATFAALIAAHEIAHVFGSPHDGDVEGACATTNGNYLMAPRINGSQQFSACSLEQMAPRVAAASCLVKLDTAGLPEPPASPVTQGDGGGGGAVAGSALALLGLMGLARARRRLAQIRANQSAR